MGDGHPLKEIARQAGVGLATVDRVIHGRSGVRASTKRRVAQAIEELSRQTLETSLQGRRLSIDLVMAAPDRFSSAVRNALEAQLPQLMPIAMRVRAHLGETATHEEIAAILTRIRKRGSNGILLKAPDHPAIRDEIDACARARIPVITLVTDLQECNRLAYVGLDNHAAGQTAAWLIAGWMPPPTCTGLSVLVVISSARFKGEEERERGFRDYLARHAPHLRIHFLGEGNGLDWQTLGLVEHALVTHPEIEAIYSIGGGNRAIATALNRCKRVPRIFIGHDLDRDNLSLLADRVLTAVLHHDLNADMLLACQLLIEANRLRPTKTEIRPSPAQIITPLNLPGFCAPSLPSRAQKPE